MLALYGERFTALWTHSTPGAMKIIWAEALGGFSGATLAAALKACLNESYCPNLPQFVAICRQNIVGRATIKDELIIPKDQAAEILREAQRRSGMELKKPLAYDYKAWAKELKKRYLAGEDLIYMQEKMASEALGEVWSNRHCSPKAEAVAA